MKKYRKLPVVIEAMQYKGGLPLSLLKAVSGGSRSVTPTADGLEIETLEGTMLARKGDYIIKGVSGELYPCKPDVFHKTYEEVEE